MSQAAFIAEQAAQCGYCASGMVMASAALLAKKPDASLDDAKPALANAVFDATGRRLRTVPFTRERVKVMLA